MTPEERKLCAKQAAHAGWANTVDRSARTAKARRTFIESFFAGLDPSIPVEARLKMAEAGYKAHFAKMAYRSVRARNAKAAARKAAKADGAPDQSGRRRHRTELPEGGGPSTERSGGR
jgi:hypothetical protein